MRRERKEWNKQAVEQKGLRSVSRFKARRFPTGLSGGRLLPFYTEQR